MQHSISSPCIKPKYSWAFILFFLLFPIGVQAQLGQPRLTLSTNLTRYLINEANLGVQYRFPGQWFVEAEGGYKWAPAMDGLWRQEPAFTYLRGAGFRARVGGGLFLAATNDLCFMSLSLGAGAVNGGYYWLEDYSVPGQCEIIESTKTVFGSIDYRFGINLPVFKFLHLQAITGLGYRLGSKETEYRDLGHIEGMNEGCFPSGAANYPFTSNDPFRRLTAHLGVGIVVPIMRYSNLNKP